MLSGTVSPDSSGSPEEPIAFAAAAGTSAFACDALRVTPVARHPEDWRNACLGQPGAGVAAALKLSISILVALTAVNAHAAERSAQFAAGLTYYTAAEFKKAASVFRPLCDAGNDAEACYWTGTADERMADGIIPFGCRSGMKARQYFLKANADCSRSALREVAGILSSVPKSDAEYDLMRARLEEEARLDASMNDRLGRIFLIIPRAAYRLATLPGEAFVRQQRVAGASPNRPAWISARPEQ